MSDRRTPTYRDVQPVRDLVTEDEAYEAMVYLDTIPHDYAIAYADIDYENYMMRSIEAVGALYSTETANDRRLWDARQSDAYAKHAKRVRDAQVRFKEIEARRAAAILKIEVYRTIRADKRAREVQEGREADRGRGYDRGGPRSG
jgi:hypothetical protein